MDKKSALRFARYNPQVEIVHPRFAESVRSQCHSGFVLCHVDGYRATSRIIKSACFVKTGITAHGNGLKISVREA